MAADAIEDLKHSRNKFGSLIAPTLSETVRSICALFVGLLLLFIVLGVIR